MPVMAGCLFTWFLDSENVVLLKAFIAVMQLMWLVYDIHLSNYVGIAVDIISVITCIVGIFRAKAVQP